MDEKTENLPHSVLIENRERITLSGVTDVGAFDENTLTVFTSYGEITVKGENLQVTSLSLDTGEVSADGTVSSLVYSAFQKKQGGFFARLLS